MKSWVFKGSYVGVQRVVVAMIFLALPAMAQVVIPPIQQRTPAPGLTILKAPAGSSVAVIYDLSGQGGNSTSDVYGVMHALDAFGIPYTVTGDLSTALLAPEMLIVAGRVEDLPSALLSSIRTELPKWAALSGHTLWMSAAKDPSLLAGFGLAMTSSQTTNERDVMYLDQGNPLNAYADTPEEQEVWLARVDLPVTVITRSYASNGSSSWVANNATHYIDGEGAVVVSQNASSGGRAILVGVKFGDLFLRMETILNKLHTRGSMNLFEPSTDTVRLWFRRAYEIWTTHPHLREFAPEGKKFAVILTHDMDATTAFDPLDTLYRPFEISLGVRSTIFETTSYRSNGWISAFYTKPEDQVILGAAIADGFDVQSHSVSHLPDMGKWAMGVDILDPAQYAPQYDTLAGVTTGGTVIPEMAMSARFLKNDFGLNVRGWRSGHLEKPRYFGQLLGATGYSYDSSYEANRIGGTFPFVMMADNAGVAGDESQVLEIPLPISDSIFSTMTSDEAVATWLDVTNKNGANNAPTVILVHPTHPEIKFPAYQAYVEAVTQNPDAWVGTMDAWYTWYRKQGIRSQQNAAPDTTAPTVILTAPTDGSTVSGTISLTASASDNIDIAKVEFYIGGVLLGTSTGSSYSIAWDTTTVSDGTYQLSAKAYDTSGNTATSTPVTVVTSNGIAPPPQDVTAPNTSMTCNASSCTAAWYNTSVSVGLSAADEAGGSGVIGTRYTIDGSEPTLVNGITYAGAFSINQTTTVKFRSWDNAGNEEAVQSQTINVDLSAPSTTISCNSATCSTGWYKAGVTVALAGADGAGSSGVSITRYTTDGTDPSLNNGVTYSGPFSVTQTRTLKFRSWDNAGNVELVQSKLIQIDQVAPTVSITSPSNGATVKTSGTTKVAANAADSGGSGVKSVSFYVDGVLQATVTSSPYSWQWNAKKSGLGKHTLGAIAADNANNSTSATAVTVTVK